MKSALTAVYWMEWKKALMSGNQPIPLTPSHCLDFLPVYPRIPFSPSVGTHVYPETRFGRFPSLFREILIILYIWKILIWNCWLNYLTSIWQTQLTHCIPLTVQVKCSLVHFMDELITPFLLKRCRILPLLYSNTNLPLPAAAIMLPLQRVPLALLNLS